MLAAEATREAVEMETPFTATQDGMGGAIPFDVRTNAEARHLLMHRG